MASKYSRETILRAIAKSYGIVSKVSQSLGCDWHTAKKYIEKWDETKNAFSAETEGVKDVVASKLYLAIEAGEAWAIRFFANNQMQDRGYGWRRFEISNQGPARPVEITFREPETTED